MAVTGCESLGLVVQVSETGRGDLKEAQKQLESLTTSARKLTEEANKKMCFLKGRDEELKEKAQVLHREIGSAEGSLRQLKASVNSLEAEKAGMNAVLEDHKRELRRAESEMRDAERRKENSTTGTVAGGVAAGLLGIFFPPSLAVTVPAVAAFGGITIAQAQKKVDQKKRAVSEIECSISNKYREIERQNSRIREIECNISTLESQKRSLEQEWGQQRQTIVFLQQAISYFEELKVAAEGGEEITEPLYHVAKKFTARQTYSITSSKGCQKTCHSFMEAWRNIQEKLNAGEPFPAITCQ